MLTHRLDRFWLPILPPLAILAGLGADWSRSRALDGLARADAGGWRSRPTLVYCSTALAGLNEWTGDLARLRTERPPDAQPAAGPARRRACPPGPGRCWSGQAAVFHLDRPIVYNTVFNDETIETHRPGAVPGGGPRGAPPAGVTHVYVDWSEVERYRSPGNYGFTPFVTPEVFARLVEAGVLKPPTRPGLRQELYEVAAGPGRSTGEGGSHGRAGRWSRAGRGSSAATWSSGWSAGASGSGWSSGRGPTSRTSRPGSRSSAPTSATARRPAGPSPGARWVYHLAANPNLWARDRREFDAVNHRGTIHVLDAALEGGAERVVHVSTESILTRARSTGPIAEDVEVAALRRGRALLPVQAPGRERGDGPGPGRGPGGHRQPDDAGRARATGASRRRPA